MICLGLCVLSGSTEEPDNTNGSKSNHQHKEVSGRQAGNAQPDLHTESTPPFAALTDPKKGVKGAHGPCQVVDSPDARKPSYVDEQSTFVLSGSTEEPDNTNGSKSNHQHKEGVFLASG